MPITIETQSEFVQRNGNDPIDCGNIRVFSNGATMSADDSPRGGWRRDPPTDPHELLRLQHRRAKELLRRAETDFNRAQSAMTEQCAHAMNSINVAAPGENDVQYLKHLASEVQTRRQELAAIEQKIAGTPQGKARRQRQENETRRRSQITTIHQQILGVQVPGIQAEPDVDPRQQMLDAAAIREGNNLFNQALGIKTDDA